MKRFISFLLIFLNIAALSSANSIINDIELFSKLFPRTEGSANEKETILLIKERLDNINVPNTGISFSEAAGYHSFSSIIEADISGEIKDSIITIVPVNSDYNIAAALSLIEHYKISKPGLTLKFVFLGAEESYTDNLGTRNFLEQFYPETAAAFIYFNFKAPAEAIRIVSGADGYSSPFFLFDSVKKSLDLAGIARHHSNIESMLFRLSAAGTESRIKPYLEQDYPAIELTDLKLNFDENHEILKEDQLSDFYDNLINSFSEGIPPDWDKHYIFGFSEQIYLLIYVILITLLMIYPIFRRRHFGWYMHTLVKNIWFLPVLFGSIFLFLSFGSMLLSFILNRIGFQELWKFNPIIVFLFKISIALFIYSLAFKLISRLPFSKRGSFYSISAIFFLVISLFILTVINLSLSFFALWPLCFIFLFTVFRKPAIKLIMLLLSTVGVVFSLIEIFTIPSFPAIKLLTLSPIQGDLLIAIILIPFILAAIRLDLLSPPSKKVTVFIPIALGLLSAGLFILIITYSPFNVSNPQPVGLKEIINESTGSRDVSLESPMKIDNDAADSFIPEQLPPATDSNEIKIDVSTRAFLNRKIVNTIIDFAEAPETVRISLLSNIPVTLFESSYPATWLPSRNRLELFIGKNPEIPIEFSLTLNKNAGVNFIIEAVYPTSSERILINGNYYLLSRSKTRIKHYNHEQ